MKASPGDDGFMAHAKQCIPMRNYLKKLQGRYQEVKLQVLPRYFVGNAWMSSLYYLLFSNKFRREQHAVLLGKVKHLEEMRSKKSNIYTLVRNTHRLEKGLLMRPRREVFALDFIGETVDAFSVVWQAEKMADDAQYKWFHDVLRHYFDTSGSHALVKKQGERFYRIVAGLNEEKPCNSMMIPYCRVETEKPRISYEDFYRLCKYRRSVRWFLNQKVPRELVDKAIAAAGQSPSACNRQPFAYRVIDEPELLKQVANLPMGVKGYVSGITMMIVIVGNLDAYFDERDRHVIYIDASLANMSLMLALETLGLSSCPINWPDIETLEKKMEKVLRLDGHQRALMCMAVGYPDPEGKVAFSAKRKIDHFRRYN